MLGVGHVARRHRDGLAWGWATTLLLGSSQPRAFLERLVALLPGIGCLASQPWDLAGQAARADVIVLGDAVIDETVLRLAPRLGPTAWWAVGWGGQWAVDDDSSVNLEGS